MLIKKKDKSSICILSHPTRQLWTVKREAGRPRLRPQEGREEAQEGRRPRPQS